MTRGKRDQQITSRRAAVNRKIVRRLTSATKHVDPVEPGKSAGADKPGRGSGKK